MMTRPDEQGRTRRSAEERRDDILEAAIEEFASYGLHGGSTERIARSVGISQPYIFRLFGTKKELFLAAGNRVCDRILLTFRAATLQAPDKTPTALLQAMGRAWEDLLARRAEILLLLQCYAAANDEEVRRMTQARYSEIRRYVQGASRASDEEVRAFLGYGMLSTVATAIEMPELLQGTAERDT